MVTMSNVWDRAMDVVRGRTGQLGGIAAATLFLPGVVRDAVPLVAAPGSIAFATLSGVLTIVVLLLAIWGQLALLATATDPATTRADAFAQATRRFGASLAVSIVALIAVFVLLIPYGIAIGMSGADFSGLTTTGRMPDVGAGTLTFITLYTLVLGIAGLLVAGRLVLVNPVVLNERRGLGAFARSWQLTRGLTWRILGVLILYVIVVLVAVSAAQFITGALFGLILGRTAPVVVLAAIAAGVVTTIFSVIASAFTAQLYVAVSDRGVATVFE